jgi:hypothetical protein
MRKVECQNEKKIGMPEGFRETTVSQGATMEYVNGPPR